MSKSYNTRYVTQVGRGFQRKIVSFFQRFFMKGKRSERAGFKNVFKAAEHRSERAKPINKGVVCFEISKANYELMVSRFK